MSEGIYPSFDKLSPQEKNTFLKRFYLTSHHLFGAFPYTQHAAEQESQNSIFNNIEQQLKDMLDFANISAGFKDYIVRDFSDARFKYKVIPGGIPRPPIKLPIWVDNYLDGSGIYSENLSVIATIEEYSYRDAIRKSVSDHQKLEHTRWGWKQPFDQDRYMQKWRSEFIERFGDEP